MTTGDGEPPALARRLRTPDAVLIGLGSMVGAGVFAVFGPAAETAGAGLLIGLVIAGVVAYCNATASAQLAAAYPTSGGTYVYGRAQLGEWWGFTAGWSFLIGKTASCAAMATTAAAYAIPAPGWTQRLVGVAAVLGLAALNYQGITRTAALTRLLVGASLTVLSILVVTAAVALGTGSTPLAPDRLEQWGGAYGVLQAAGLLFFAFAGYARIATLGEEVRDPERTIPRAILISLAAAFVVYLSVGIAALLAAGPQQLAASPAPLVTVAESAGAAGLAPVVRVGATFAALGALLALIAGVGRTGLAMARHGDLPRWLAAVHPRHRVPHHAELAVAGVVSALVLTTDLRGVIGFSSFGVLLYYAIANLAALTQDASRRRWPRGLQVLGVVGCLGLSAALPPLSVLVGAAVLAVGLVGRRLVLGRRERASGRQPKE